MQPPEPQIDRALRRGESTERRKALEAELQRLHGIIREQIDTIAYLRDKIEKWNRDYWQEHGKRTNLEVENVELERKYNKLLKEYQMITDSNQKQWDTIKYLQEENKKLKENNLNENIEKILRDLNGE